MQGRPGRHRDSLVGDGGEDGRLGGDGGEDVGAEAGEFGLD